MFVASSVPIHRLSLLFLTKQINYAVRVRLVKNSKTMSPDSRTWVLNNCNEMMHYLI